MFKFILFLGLLWSPPETNDAIITGSAICTRSEYRLKEPEELDEPDEDIFKTVEIKSYENIGIYLIPSIYFEGDYEFHERLAHCEAKCLTNSKGEFFFFAKPDKQYRIVAVVGGKMSVAYCDIVTKEKITKLGKMKLRIYR